jgi:hypothetical protein
VHALELFGCLVKFDLGGLGLGDFLFELFGFASDLDG